MLLIIIAIVYCTIISWAWGSIAITRINYWMSDELNPIFSTICIFGLSLIGTTLQLIHIFLPLGGWLIHLFLAAPAFYLLFFTKNATQLFFQSVKRSFCQLNIYGLLFFISACLFFILVGCWHIINPDTLGYHAPIIEWNLKYPLVKGIANINGRLGYQSSWFLLCAVFRFDFLQTNAITFINTTLLCWFALLLSHELSKLLQQKSPPQYIWIWLVLVAICVGTSTQFFLAASSANPDFIICIFLWTSFYYLLNLGADSSGPAISVVTIFMVGFCVSLKLSALPALLLLPVFYLKPSHLSPLKRFILIIILPALSIVPFLYQNIIITGYPLFPSRMMNIFSVNWKLSPDLAKEMDEYITAYARVQQVELYKMATVLKLSAREWLPIWWTEYGVFEKGLVVGALTATAILILFIKRLLLTKKHVINWITLVCILSSTVLLLKAPAPRFSQAFLVPIILITLYHLINWGLAIKGMKFLTSTLVAILIFAIVGYDIYRVSRYFDARNLLEPSGVATYPNTIMNCNGMNITVPDDPNNCGFLSLPCANNPCTTFLPRGKTIEEGFIPRTP